MLRKNYLLLFVIFIFFFALLPLPGNIHAQYDSANTEVIEPMMGNRDLFPSKNGTVSFLYLEAEETKRDHLSALRSSPEAVNEMASYANRMARVKLNQDVVASKAVSKGTVLRIPVFEGKEYLVKIDNAVTENKLTTLVGSIEGSDNGYFLMSSHEGLALASLKLFDENKELYIAYNHELRGYHLYELYSNEVPQPKLMPGLEYIKQGDDLRDNQITRENETETDFQATKEIGASGPNDPATIDLLVVYTPAAKTWATNNATSIENAVNLSHNDGQIALNNSLTGVTLRRVDTREIDYAESGDQVTDLLRLTFTYNVTFNGKEYTCTPYMDEVHGWRDTVSADMVTLLMHHPNSVPGGGDSQGAAWVYDQHHHPQGLPEAAFSISEIFCYRQYIQIHEIGHNLGAGHHRRQSSAPGPQLFDYSAGWRYESGGIWYSTIMAYNWGYSETQDGPGIISATSPYFSNPSVTHGGVATGHATEADNARTIRETKHIIASYREADEVQNGSIQIFIEPDGTRNAGAQWQLTGGPDQDWKNCGDIINDLPVGSYTVTFKDISGWTKPSEISVDIAADTLATKTGTYTEIEPDCSVNIPDQPSGPSSGETDTSYAYSTGGASCEEGHSVEYRFEWGDGTYSSWSTLTSKSNSWSDTGTYSVRVQARCAEDTSAVSNWSSARTVIIEVPTGSLQVTIEPSAARNAGAQWRLTGGPDQGWKNCGATMDDLPVGSYTVTFKDISGWTKPSEISVDIAADTLATRIGFYKLSPTSEIELTANPGSRQVINEDITFTATVTEGNKNAEFAFWYKLPGAKWVNARPYSTDNTWTVNTSYLGEVEIGVQARAAGSGAVDEVRDIIEYELVEVVPVESVKLSADPPISQLKGEVITFTAEIAEGNNNAEFAFYNSLDGVSWTLGRSYDQDPTWKARTSYVGEAKVGVIARAVGSEAFEEARDMLDYEIVEEPPDIAAVSGTAINASNRRIR